MTLEQAIHRRWAACPPLIQLLSADRFKTGRSSSARAPYAALHREKTRTVCRTNDGRLDEVGLRIDLWHEDYSAGRAVVCQIDAAFDGCSFPMDAGQRLLALRRTGQFQHQHDDGLWQFTVEFQARIFIPRSPQP